MSEYPRDYKIGALGRALYALMRTLYPGVAHLGPVKQRRDVAMGRVAATSLLAAASVEEINKLWLIEGIGYGLGCTVAVDDELTLAIIRERLEVGIQAGRAYVVETANAVALAQVPAGSA